MLLADDALRRRSAEGPRRISDTDRRRISDVERGANGTWRGEVLEYDTRCRHHSARTGRRRSSDPNKDDTDEVILYEGAGGKHSQSMFYTTTLMVTDWSVEVEREGANPLLTVLTLGLWFWLFQTVSTEVFELERVVELEMRNGLIVGAYQHTWCCGGGSFRIDIPDTASKKTHDVFRELKRAWTVARMDAAEAAQRDLEAHMLLDDTD